MCGRGIFPFILPKNGQIYKRFLKFFARGGEICLPFLRLQKDFRKQRKKCEHIFLGKDYDVHFFGTPQRSEPNENIFRCAKQQVFLACKASIAQSANEKRCAHGAAAPKYPAASRANAVAPRRLIRTRLPESRNFAFAASKRTAKTEKLTRVGFEALLGLLGGKLLRFEPRERGYGIKAAGRGFCGENSLFAPRFLVGEREGELLARSSPSVVYL